MDGIDTETEGTWNFKCHDSHETVSGNSFHMVIGAEEGIYLGNYTHIKPITVIDITIALDLELKMHCSFPP